MKYTIETRDGCTLVRGSAPLSDLAGMMRRSGKGAVLSTDLARMAGASFAWGPSEAVTALEYKLRTEKLADMEAAPPQPGGLSKAARRWLAVGEHGLSSCAMFWRMTGVKPHYIEGDDDYAYPHDPGDLRRCMLLLDQVPELQPKLCAMSGCSPEWNALVSHWDELASLLESEFPGWSEPNPRGSAPKTYAKMKEVMAR